MVWAWYTRTFAVSLQFYIKKKQVAEYKEEAEVRKLLSLPVTVEKQQSLIRYINTHVEITVYSAIRVLHWNTLTDVWGRGHS